VTAGVDEGNLDGGVDSLLKFTTETRVLAVYPQP
jgi:hypothetical protein